MGSQRVRHDLGTEQKGPLFISQQLVRNLKPNHPQREPPLSLGYSASYLGNFPSWSCRWGQSRPATPSTVTWFKPESSHLDWVLPWHWDKHMHCGLPASHCECDHPSPRRGKTPDSGVGPDGVNPFADLACLSVLHLVPWKQSLSWDKDSGTRVLLRKWASQDRISAWICLKPDAHGELWSMNCMSKLIPLWHRGLSFITPIGYSSDAGCRRQMGELAFSQVKRLQGWRQTSRKGEVVKF